MSDWLAGLRDDPNDDDADLAPIDDTPAAPPATAARCHHCGSLDLKLIATKPDARVQFRCGECRRFSTMHAPGGYRRCYVIFL